MVPNKIWLREVFLKYTVLIQWFLKKCIKIYQPNTNLYTAELPSNWEEQEEFNFFRNNDYLHFLFNPRFGNMIHTSLPVRICLI